MSEKTEPGRRQFFKKTAAGVIGVSLAGQKGWSLAGKEDSEKGLKIKEYRLLGKTGFKVSDIGAGSIMDEGVLGTALDAGVNYIDSAEEYPGHHRVVANVLKGRNRESIFITTKLQIKEDKSKEGFVKRTLKCLEELETDYVDCLMMHMPENIETLKTEGFHEAMADLKTQGKVRFVGVSHHGSFWLRAPEESMEKILLEAADDGRFDIFMFAYNFLKMDQGEKVLEVCRKRNIGTVLMKTTPVAIYYSLKSRVENLEKEGKEVHPLYKEGLQRYKNKVDKAFGFLSKYNLSLENPDEIKKTAVKFVLENPDVSTVCCLARTYQEMELFLGLSGARPGKADQAKLRIYRRGCSELYCRHACGACEQSCPKKVPVNTIMRYFQYFVGQGREREAMEKYAKLSGFKADVCSSCPGYCEASCPYHVPVQGMLFQAHRLLSLP